MREGEESSQDEKERKEILHKKGRRGKLRVPLHRLRFPSGADQGSGGSGHRSQVHPLKFILSLGGESLCPVCVVPSCGRGPCRGRSVEVAGPAEVREGLRLGGTSGGRLVQTCPPSWCSAPGEPAAPVCVGMAAATGCL